MYKACSECSVSVNLSYTTYCIVTDATSPAFAGILMFPSFVDQGVANLTVDVKSLFITLSIALRLIY